MKKSLMIFLGLFLILTAKPFAGRSQPLKSDTLCFPVSVIQKVLIAARQKAILEERVALKDSEIVLLRQSVASWKTRDANNKEIFKSFEAQDSVRIKQTATALDAVANLNRQLKRERRKKTWTAVAGALGMAGAFFLGTKL